LTEEPDKHNSFLSLLRQQELVGEDKLTIQLPGGRTVKINPARILLTILENCVQTPDEDDEGRVSITTLYGYYREVFSHSFEESQERCLAIEFLSLLSELFKFSRKGMAHLVTIYGEDKVNEDLLVRYAKGRLSVDEKRELAKVVVTINPSARIYLDTIVSHFEFYTLRENYGRGRKASPLFVLTGVKQDKNSGRSECEFFSRIRRTFDFTKKCVDSLNEFLQVPEFSDYPNSKAAPRTGNKTPTLFVKQIIHNHIRYLDCFRIYITHNHAALRNYAVAFSQSEGQVVYRINDFILSYMKKYNESFSEHRRGTHPLYWLKPEDFARVEQNLCEQGGYKDPGKGYHYVVHEKQQ